MMLLAFNSCAHPKYDDRKKYPVPENTLESLPVIYACTNTDDCSEDKKGAIAEVFCQEKGFENALSFTVEEQDKEEASGAKPPQKLKVCELFTNANTHKSRCEWSDKNLLVKTKVFGKIICSRNKKTESETFKNPTKS